MLGQEAWRSDWDYTYQENSNLPNNMIHLPSLGSSTPIIKSGFGVTTMSSFFTRETYNYDDRYLATYTFRRDGSSNFGPETVGHHSILSLQAGVSLTRSLSRA